jgi:UDPglucose 6-dehydrogenase
MASGRLILCDTQEAALQGADALLICTEWQQFRAPDFDLLRQTLKQAIIFDGRNLYDPARLRQRGFTYYAIGRGDSLAHQEER